MLRFRRPPRSFVIFLLAVVGVGAALGHVVNAAGIAVFFFFIAGIDPKPAWKFQLMMSMRGASVANLNEIGNSATLISWRCGSPRCDRCVTPMVGPAKETTASNASFFSR